MNDRPDVDVLELHDAVLREGPEPQDGDEPAPMWMWLTAALTIAWSAYYLGAYSGDYDVRRMDLAPQVTREAEVEGPPTYEDRDPLELGQERFARCASCHQADGRGVPGRYPPLAGSEWVAGDPEILARILLHGLQGPIEVKGEPYNDVMPSWGFWTDAEIAAVLTYVRASFGNDAPAIETETVRAVRAATGERTTPWTSAELRAVEAGDGG